MSKSRMDLVRAWKAKSDSDLLTCRRLMSFDDPTVDTILFHAQQAVEKALKAFLLYHRHELPKTHDLMWLLDVAVRYDCKLEALDDVVELNPFAVEIRYPESMGMDSDVDCEAYVQLAEKACRSIWQCVEGI